MSPPVQPTRFRQSGFSLLEIVLAVAVFGLIAAAGYAGLDQLSRSAGIQREAAAELEQLQLTMALLEQDLAQTINRPVTDANGRELAALIGDSTQFSLTRSGWSNPLALPRSELKRVMWRFDGQRWQRWLWPVLDRLPLTQPRLDQQLENVIELRCRYRDHSGGWHDQWPQDDTVSPLPAGIEIVLQRGPDNRLRRLLELPR
ncbi:MAG: type II secretion system minor pseudopilin GspJ [Wenzhouxiangellaceae bacterium]